MISDFVKGRTQYHFPEGIQKGIRLHRLIDDYTDQHAATHSAKLVFRPHYRLYSAPIVDVVYDHFLAADRTLHSEEELKTLASETYAVLDANAHLLPPRFAAMLPYMKQDNWLYGYQTPDGIRRSLQGLMRRASMADDGAMAFQLLQTHRSQLEAHYLLLLPDVKQFAKARFQELIA